MQSFPPFTGRGQDVGNMLNAGNVSFLCYASVFFVHKASFGVLFTGFRKTVSRNGVKTGDASLGSRI